MSAGETMVRMGELAATDEPGHALVALGLGSCIGLALLDPRRGAAGLAHVVLPDSDGRATDNPTRFADHAVPALLAELDRLGARRSRLEAVLVGGASMFEVKGGAGLDVGRRNAAAVHALLAGARVPVVAEETGGRSGRTVRVHPGAGRVTVRAAGGRESALRG